MKRRPAPLLDTDGSSVMGIGLINSWLQILSPLLAGQSAPVDAAMGLIARATSPRIILQPIGLYNQRSQAPPTAFGR